VKKLLYLITLYSLLTTSVTAQWWVQGGNVQWPHGRVNIKKLLVYDNPTSYSKALSLLKSQEDEITTLFYKNKQNWFPALRSVLDIDSSAFNGTTHILPALFTAELTMNHGQQNSVVFGSQSWVRNSISGNFIWGPFSEIRGVTGEVVLNASKGNLPYATGVASVFSSESGSTDSINLGVGFWSDWNRWAPGSTHVNTFYSFHSSRGGLFNGGYNAPANVTIDNFYHFYGKGDYPSYFGGAMVQKVYTYDVENPPSQGELDTFFGTPEEAGSGFNVFIDDNAESTNFYHIVSDGVRWWVFTAVQAP
jgi:hypothetical protein